MPNITMKEKDKIKTPIDKGQKKYVEKNPKVLALKGQRDRKVYLEWAAMPAMLRMMTPVDLERMGYDIHDPVFMKLQGIKRKGELCSELGINANMPAKWEKEPTFYQEMNALSSKSHIMKFKKDVDFSFTQKVIRHGDAARTKLWYQKNESWSERTESVNLNMNMTPADLVRDIEERNRKIRGE